MGGTTSGGPRAKTFTLIATITFLTALATGCTSAAEPPTDASTGTTAPPPTIEKPRQHPGAEPEKLKIRLTKGTTRRSKRVVAAGGADAPYNYGPTVMVDGKRLRMWWCSQYGKAKPAGDDILHASARRVSDRFTGPRGGMPRAVFSGSRRGFDGKHTCDPSVIKVNGVYYLYYTGARGDHAFGNSIGLATSKDGVRWRRANGGKPIVSPSLGKRRANRYGVGQPAAVHVDGKFYLMFTDTTAQAAGWNGAGQFLLRSPDPAFREDVEALSPEGFVSVRDTKRARTSSLADAFSADLVWIDVLDAFAVAHQTVKGTTLTFWDREFKVNPLDPISVPGPWREGPGLVRGPRGHAPISVSDPCGTIPVDVVRATKDTGAPTDIRHYGLDLHGAPGCTDPFRALKVLDGYAMPSPERTMDLVVRGKLVRVDRRSVAVALASRVLERRPAQLVPLRVDARLPAGAPVLYAPSHGGGMLLSDGRIWPLALDGLADLNGSPERTVSDRKWTSLPLGTALG